MSYTPKKIGNAVRSLSSFLLLADAKVFEDMGQGFVGGYGSACDFTQLFETDAEVFREKISAEVEPQPLDDSGDAGVGTGEGFIMAGIGHDDGVGVEVWNVGSCVDGFFQFVKALSVFGADGYCREGVG